MSRLVSFNTQALLMLERSNTKCLDDFSRPRSEMATASEICGCHRKVTLQVTLPALPSARELRQKRRGHIFEIDQAERFQVMGFTEVSPKEFPTTTGPCFTRQLVIEHPDQPIGSHLDFVVKHKDGSIHIIECKTTDGIPVEPYGNWVDQLHIQLGLLAVNFTGIEIRGSIIASDLSAGEEEEYNSFSPDMTLLDYYVERGKELIEAKAGRTTPTTMPGVLCGFCSYRGGCPAHKDQEVPREITDRVAEYECLDRRKKDLEKSLDPMKKELIAFFGKRFQGVTEDGIAVATTTIAPGETVDSATLKADFPDVFKNCSRPKAGYTKLEIRKLPTAPLAKAA
jgi:CRISPR-associated exonuclease Cas4